MRRTSAGRIGAIVLGVVTLLSVSSASGEVPRKISYQGMLVDATGAVMPGTHTAVFRIFDSDVGGTELWSESQSIDVDSLGVFSVLLGSVDSIDTGFEGTRWLESEARANAWNLLSSRQYKRDVEPLSPAQCREILEKAASTDVVRYTFANDPAAVEHLGVIAEESPAEIVAPDGEGVSIGDYAAFLLAAVKAQQAEIEDLRAQVRDLQSRVGGQ